MTVTIQLTDEALSELKDVLRVTHKDMQRTASEPCSDLQQDYAWRILRARNLLDLSNASADCCIDYVRVPSLVMEKVWEPCQGPDCKVSTGREGRP